MNIDSFPSGAEVYDQSRLLGVTPLKVELEKQTFDPHSIRIVKEGYEEASLQIDKEFNITSLMNLIIIPSWAIDLLTGALVKYKANYRIELKPTPSRRRSIELARFPDPFFPSSSTF